MRGYEVKTPTFMPDGTRGAVKSLTPEMVESTGVGIVLANTYHLHLMPGEDVVAELGGLHAFTQQDLPLLTDSGGFQVFSLSHINKITEEGVQFKDPRTGNTVFLSPEKSIQIQMKLGADMIVAFDDVVSLEDSKRGRTLEAYERTHRWLERSIAEYERLTKGVSDKEKPLLFGVVQGGLDKELRKKSLEVVQSSSVGGIAIGGLSVGESRAEMHEMLEFLAPFYDDSPRPRFLLGVGDPIDLRKAIECGIDMLDCVLPTRNARHGSVWIHSRCTASACQAPEAPVPQKLTANTVVTSSGSPSSYQAYDSVRSSGGPWSSSVCTSCGKPFDKKLNLKSEIHAKSINVIDDICDCYTCKSGFSRGFLRHQFKVGEPLAGTLASIHNIRYLQRICEEYQ